MNNTVLLQNIDAFQAALTTASSIGIIIGSDQNLDKMAAGLALYLSLTQAGKNVQIISSKDPIVEHSNLVAIDKIKRSFSGLTKTIVVSVPFREGEVEKVSYSTEGDRMNFSIIGGETGIHAFDVEDIKIMNRGSAPDFIITIGVPQESEISAFVDNVSGTKIMNIDNSDVNGRYGDIQFVDRGFSSISEIVTIILQELALPLDIDTAQNLMDGVSQATNNFTSMQTGSFAFESAAILLRVGAKRAAVNMRPQNPQSDFARPQNQPRNNSNNTNGRPQNRPQQPVNNQSMVRQPQSQPAPVQPAMPRVQSQPMPQPQYNSMGIENKEAKPLNDDLAGEPQDIPSDWFVPKVFKGSKKPGQA